MTSTWQFVDAISASPTVRLDLNDLTTFRVLRGPRLDPPPLKRSRSSSMLVDGDIISAGSYENRELKFSLQISAASQDALATQLQTLIRELDRPTNLLKFLSNGGTKPVFFQTFRTPPEAIEIDPYPAGQTKVTLTIEALPFALGLSPGTTAVTVNNDVANGTNGMFFDISGVTGDLLTPLFIHASSINNGQKQLMAVRRHGTPANAAWFRQAEAMTAGTDTTVQANDATASGAGSNFMRTTFTNANLVTRVSGNLPVASPSTNQRAELRGSYRVFGRFRLNNFGDTIKVQMQYAGFSADVVTLPHTLQVGTPWFWVDLGQVSFPTGADPVDPGYGASVGVDVMAFSFLASRTGSTTTLDWDTFLLVPADEELCTVTWPAAISGHPYWDGPSDANYLLDSGDAYVVNVQSGDPPARAGGIPMLAPNQTNRVFFMRQITSSTDSPANDLITDTTAFTYQYWPRFLYISP